MSKEYSYKAVSETGTIIHLSKTSDYDYQEQTENEYLLTDNYSIIEETYDTETEIEDAVVIMKKFNGIVQKFNSPKYKARKPIKLKITYTNGDVEIVNRMDALKRFDATVKIGDYNKGQEMYDVYCIKSIERVVKRATKTTLGSGYRAFEMINDTITMANEILN